MKRTGATYLQTPITGMDADWYTPEPLFRDLEQRFGPFTLDVAANDQNAKCAEYFTEEQDGRVQPWHGRVWCNPPYKDLIKWVSKAHEETRSGRCEIAVLLLPAQTSTAWFHDFALQHAEIYWIRGKQKFGGRRGSAMVGSLALIFRRPEEATA
jgi:phage N-6-adenine-methyltransferase